MAGWSGIAVGAIVLAVVLVGVGQPLWEWRLSDPVEVETWSYSLFTVTHTVENRTLGNTTVESFTYLNLPSQPRMSAFFATVQTAFYGFVACLAAAIGLSVATLRRKLRGAFPGAALAAGALIALLVPLFLVLDIAPAADDLRLVNGNPLPGFEGQLVVNGANTVLAWGPDLMWYLFLGLCLLLAFGASEIWSLQPIRKAAAAKPAARVAEPPPPEPPTPAPPEPGIEEVFLIGSNGLLIKHLSRSLMTDKDRDVVGGMISVLSNFVRETFSEREGNDVQEVTLGEHRFILCNQAGVVVAVLVTQGETEVIVPRLRHLLACLIDRYGDQLDNWGGEPLEGLEDEMQVLWQPFFLPPPPLD